MRHLLIIAALMPLAAHADRLDDEIRTCAPMVTPSTMRAIVKVESGGNPYAINVNHGGKLRHQPRSRREAISVAARLIRAGYDIDMGIGQINVRNMRKFGLSVSSMFDACRNLHVAGTILLRDYEASGDVYKAVSRYNTGDSYAGFRNGYVGRVARAAGYNVPVQEHRAHVEQVADQLVVYSADNE